MDGEGECAVLSEVHGRRVALLACGYFNPPTYMHLRMFERARDYLEKTHSCIVVEGILSPVADTLGKPDVLAAEHRLKMVQLAVRNSTWLRADGWECSQNEWTRTLHVLHHFKKQLGNKYGDCSNAVRLLLLCGADVLESFDKTDASGSRIWKLEHVEEIVRDFGLVVIARSNSDPMKTVYMVDVLRKHQKNIHFIEDETCPNDISSTRLRMAVRRKESIRYCTDDEVISYIETNKLYSFPSTTRELVHESAKASSSSSPASTETIVKCPRPPQPPKRFSFMAPQKIHRLPLTSPSHTTKLSDDLLMKTADLEPIWRPSSEEPQSSLGETTDKGDTSEAVAERHSIPRRRSILTPAEQCNPSTSGRPHTMSQISSPSAPPGLYSSSWMRSLDSPDYDNVTLDELLAASTSWAEYLCARKGRTGDGREKPVSPLVRTESLGSESCSDVDEHRPQGQTHIAVPEQSTAETYLKTGPSKASDRGTQHWREGTEGRSFSVPQRRSIRFANAAAKSVENLADSEDASAPSESLTRSMVVVAHEEHEPCSLDNSGNFTLTYRQYKLSATPETTV